MNTKPAAFTLVETLIGITLLTVVLTAVAGLILSTLISSQRNIHTLQAKAYAQEALEVMRYIRDSNWLQNYSWAGTANKSVGNAQFDADESGEAIVLYLKVEDCPPCWSFSSFERDGLLHNSQGFEFLRRLEIQPVPDENNEARNRDDVVEVNAIVEWTDKAVPRKLELSTYLSNWK